MSEDKQIKTIIQKFTDLSIHQSEIVWIAKEAIKIPYTIPQLIDEVFLKWIEQLDQFNYEVQILLSEVFRIHANESHVITLNTDLIPSVKHHWRKTLLLTHPKKYLKEEERELVNIALQTLPYKNKKQLEQVLLAIIELEEHQFDLSLIHLLNDGIKNAKLSYEVSREIVLYLLKSPSYEIVFSTCDFLKTNPYIFNECPEVALRLVLNRKGGFEPLALSTLGIWGEKPIFKEVLEGDSWSLDSKLTVLPFIKLNTQVLDLVLNLFHQFPEHGEEFLTILSKGAELGIYISKAVIPSLVNLYYKYPYDSIGKRLLNLIQKEISKSLIRLGKESDNFQLDKYLNILSYINSNEAKEEVLSLLKEEEPLNRKILLESIQNLAIREAEELVISLVEFHPVLCLNTLKKIGGQKTVISIKEHLGFKEEYKSYWPFYEQEALETIIAIKPDEIDDVITYLKKNHLPLSYLTHIRESYTSSYSSVIVESLKSKDLNELRYGLSNANKIGDEIILNLVIKLLIHENEEIADSAWSTCHNIIALITDKKSTNKETKHLLSELIVNQLREELSTRESMIYLNYLSQVITASFPVKKLAFLSASKNPHILKFYLTCLQKTTETNAVTPYLSQFLTLDQDIYTLRQVIIVLSDIPNQSFEPLVLPLLMHPNMNMKKTVADYLLKRGSLFSLPSMIKLFRSNDNRGLREKLNEGLQNILGPAYSFFLLNEFESCQTEWQKELLASTIIDQVGSTEYHNLAKDFTSLKSTSYWTKPILKESEIKIDELN